MKIALLSNVNMNFVIRSLKKEADVYETTGYGNELGILLNPGSDYHAFDPQLTFLVMDLAELIGHTTVPLEAAQRINAWFDTLGGVLNPAKIYYVSSAHLFGFAYEVLSGDTDKRKLEAIWQERLSAFRKAHENVRVFPYAELIENLGVENAYSMKTWYMGKILHSSEAQKRLGDLILHKVQVEERTAKKVLVLDLDNTLWGGLAGEHDVTPIKLSEDHGGLSYKNLQRVLLQMQKQGVLLAIASKNNEADAMEIIEHHPHMVLRKECFAAKEINWNPKHESIQKIAEQLNVGLQSFVFFDDNPSERELIREMLPEVTVPEFPEKPEGLAPAMAEIYRAYFEKPVLTEEDRKKTAQYAENAKRNEMKDSAASFEEYLRKLDICITEADSSQNLERLLQLLNKTNQFNLTTIRHTREELTELLQTDTHAFFLFGVQDCFGDNGLVAAVHLHYAEIPVIEEFVMSCRVMGRNIEQALLELMENRVKKQGFDKIRGRFLPTAKNKPVAQLYSGLGYREIESGLYELTINDRPVRKYDARIEEKA